MSLKQYKTVLHLAKFYHPRKGGIETAVKYLAENGRSNFRFVILTNGIGYRESDKSESVIVSNPYISIGSQPLSLSYVFHFFRLMRTVDLLHLHHPNYVASLLTLFSSKKLIVHWHAQVEVGSRVLNFFLGWIDRKILQKAEAIIISTESYARSSRSLSVFQSKFEIVPFGVKETKEEINFDVKDNFLLSVGRLVPYKGFKELAERIEIPDGWKWLIVGDGPLKDSILEVLKKRGLLHKVRLLGALSDEELGHLFVKAKIFLFPSLTVAESFGIVQLEAMMNGLAIMNFAINGSGVQDLIQSGVNGFTYEIGDYDSFNKGLYDLCTDSIKLDKFQRRSSIRYKQNFTLEKYQNGIEEIYGKICD